MLNNETYAELNYNVNLPIIFTTGTGSGTERMRIHTGGNVGIGTAAPVTKLHVKGTGTYNHTPANPLGADLVITSF